MTEKNAKSVWERGGFFLAQNEIDPGDYPLPDEEFAPGEGAQEHNSSRLDLLSELGQLTLPKAESRIQVIPVVGQVEGHLIMPPQNKTTKYEHLIPQLVAVEQSEKVEGMLVILNTVGGDVEAGLAIAEMIASLSKPTVSLVLGGGHSIGVPIAVAADVSFIAPTATMTIHPIRLTGMVVSVQQNFDYLERMQDRVIKFITAHSRIREEQLRARMMRTGELAHDIGTILVGREAVEDGLIDEVGGIGAALGRLEALITAGKGGAAEDALDDHAGGAGAGGH